MENIQKKNNEKMLVSVIYGLYATIMITFGFSFVIGGMLAFIKKDQIVNDIYKSHITYQLKILKLTMLSLILALAIVFIPLIILFNIDKDHQLIDFLTIPAFVILFIPILIYGGMIIKGAYKLIRDKQI